MLDQIIRNGRSSELGIECKRCYSEDKGRAISLKHQKFGYERREASSQNMMKMMRKIKENVEVLKKEDLETENDYPTRKEEARKIYV